MIIVDHIVSYVFRYLEWSKKILKNMKMFMKIKNCSPKTQMHRSLGSLVQIKTTWSKSYRTQDNIACFVSIINWTLCIITFFNEKIQFLTYFWESFGNNLIWFILNNLRSTRTSGWKLKRKIVQCILLWIKIITCTIRSFIYS